MFKQCVTLAAVLAVVVAKPNLGFTYPVPAASYVAPLATSYSFSAPAVYPTYSVYSSYPEFKTFAATAVATAPVATVAHTPVTSYSVPAYSGYAAPLAYSQYSQIPTSFLYKK